MKQKIVERSKEKVRAKKPASLRKR